MKNPENLNLPEQLRYSKEHIWIEPEGELLKVGISDYAQDQLGVIAFVDLPIAGTHIESGNEFGSVESAKAVNGLFMPVSGQVLEVNSELEAEPEKINKSPYDEGWIIKIRPDNKSDLENLLSASQYKAILGE